MSSQPSQPSSEKKRRRSGLTDLHPSLDSVEAPRSRRSIPQEVAVEVVHHRARVEVVIQESDYSVFNQTDIVKIQADGAARDNGKESAKCSTGVFVHSYSHPLSKGRKLSTTTNNAAELSSAIDAARAAITIAKHSTARNFEIEMDSHHVVAGILSGLILSYEAHSRYKNSDLWTTLKGLIEDAIKLGLSITWRWIPRNKNRRADEIANAVLDEREVDTNVANSTGLETVNISNLHKLLIRLTNRRIRFVKHLPPALNQLLVAFVQSIMLRYDSERSTLRLLFICVPAIISMYNQNIESNEDFKFLRAHLHLLQEPEYLANCIHELCNDTSIPDKVHKAAEEKHRIMSLCRKGVFHKCIRDDAMYIDHDPTPETLDIVRASFPSDTLPPPLVADSFENTQSISGPELFRSWRRLKRHKAATLSGWSRELLHPIMAALSTSLPAIFEPWFNNTCSDEERSFLKTGLIYILRYKDKPDKRRALVLLDTLIKMLWHIALENIDDPTYKKTGMLYGQQGHCQTALHVIQKALDDDCIVIHLDAVNAFPSSKRHPAFDYLQRHQVLYKRTFGMMNLMYSTVSFGNIYDSAGLLLTAVCISTGSFQGCVSGPWMYGITIIDKAKLHHGSTLHIADDVYVIARDSLQQVQGVITSFAELNQLLDGPKLTVYCKPKPLALPPCIAHATIVHTATETLGGVLVITPQTPTQIASMLGKRLKLIERKYDALIHLPTTLQCQLLILRSMTWNFLYFCESFHPSFHQTFFQHIDQIQYNAAISICKLHQTDALHVRTFSPLEDGGLGLLPYAALSSYLHNKSVVRAIPFAARVSSPLDIPQEPRYTSVQYAWKAWFKESLTALRLQNLTHSDRMYLANSRFTSWISCWPANKTTTLEDSPFTVGIQLRFDQIKPFHYDCPLAQINLFSLQPSLFTEHILTCSHCGGSHNILRHELVLHEIKKVLHKHNITSSWPTDLPRPGHRKGGADLLVFLLHAIHAVDVAVTKDKPADWFDSDTHHFKKNRDLRTNRVATTKRRTYVEFAKRTGMITVPFVLSVYGTYAETTLDILEEWFSNTPNPRSLSHNLFANTQMQLIRGISFGLHRLSSRTYSESELEAEAAPRINNSTTVLEPSPSQPINRQRSSVAQRAERNPRNQQEVEPSDPRNQQEVEPNEPSHNGGVRFVPLSETVEDIARSQRALVGRNVAQMNVRKVDNNV